MYVLNGRKWWTSGAMDPRVRLCIFMGKTDPNAAKHKQQSMFIVDMKTPGVKVLRQVFFKISLHYAPEIFKM